MDIFKLTADLTYSEVFFAIELYDGLKQFAEEHDIMDAGYTVRTVVSLMYHTKPPIPLTEEDRKAKLIYPERMHKQSRIIPEIYHIVRQFA